MNTSNLFKNVSAQNKNYAELYSLAANQVNQQFNVTNQKTKHESEFLNSQNPPQLNELNITPYIPKTSSQQSDLEESKQAKVQQYIQDNKTQHRRTKTTIDPNANNQQEPHYHFNYNEMINSQANNSGMQNLSRISTQQQQPSKIASQQLQLDANAQSSSGQDSIQSSRTPIFSNSNLTSPKSNFYGFSENAKNISYIKSPSGFTEDTSNKKSSINLQQRFDQNYSEPQQKNMNEQLSEQDQFLKQNYFSSQNSQYFNHNSNRNNQNQNFINNDHISQSIIPTTYYIHTNTNVKTNLSQQDDQGNKFTPQLDFQSVVKFNNEQNGTRVGQKNYVQSCTNSPKNRSEYNASIKKASNPIRSLNVSQHLEDFQQHQLEVLNEQQKQLNQQLKKVQSLQNSFVMVNENQNDLSTQSLPQSNRLISNNYYNQQSNSQRKEDYTSNIITNHTAQDLMNDTWAKLQVAVKTKIIRQKQQTNDDSHVLQQVNQAKEQIIVYEKELRQKEQVIQKQNKENESLKVQVQHLTDKVAYLSENVNGFQLEQNQLIKSLQNKLQEKENCLLNLQLQLKKKTSKVELNTSRSENPAEILHLKQLLIQKTDVITDLKIKNQMYREEIIQLGKLQVQKENSHPEKGQINQKKKEYNLLKQKVNLLEEDLKRFNEEIHMN